MRIGGNSQGSIPQGAGRTTLGKPVDEDTHQPAAGRVTHRPLGGDDGRTLYIVANQYGGGSEASGGIVLTERVAIAHSGRP